MRAVAYLLNRYPEATLTTVRREVRAVSDAGLTVYRFAHRQSLQPLASPADLAEAEQTQYLAAGSLMPLLLSLIRTCLRNPTKFIAALRVIFKLTPKSFRHAAYLAIACRFIERLGAAPVDLIHTHFAQNSAIVAMLARALGGPPWTMTVHGPEDIDADHLPGLASRVRAASTTVTVSQHAADVVLDVVGPGSVDVRVVGMGVDDFYLEEPVPIHEGSPIVCIARFVERKGHSVLIEALDILKSWDVLPLVQLIGDGPLSAEVSADVERRGLSNQIKFLGWQSEKDIRQCIDASAFLVLPSYAEGLPVSIMEAFARSRPVIASNVGAISELVQNGVTGMLVTPGNALCLAKAIEALLANKPNVLFDMGLRGRKIVEQRHDSRKSAVSLLKIWQNIAD
jgi:glycosyltransferase involved in cell wall biosynthesis